jgi:hypothetical protein
MESIKQTCPPLYYEGTPLHYTRYDDRFLKGPAARHENGLAFRVTTCAFPPDDNLNPDGSVG